MQSANSKIRIALIGAGGMGNGDVQDALAVGGVELVAAADIYQGRLDRIKEVHGAHVFTTRDYREILTRSDVDAVIIATPDHWHARISIDALNAGKDVYCEKPMIQTIDEGRPVIDAHKKSGRIFQVGSQYASALSFIKINQLLKSGAIGELNMVEAWLDRNTAMGAWQYSIAPDASPQTVDWDRFLGHAPKRAFEPIRLFRWRNYQDYGTAVAGDLYVHLLTGIHTATESLGPNRIYSTGGLRYWNDGRDVPDTMFAVIEYPKSPSHPEFTFAMRVNFKSSEPQEQFGFKFVGSEGTILTDVRSVTLSKRPRAEEPGYTIDTFAKDQQTAFLRGYRKQYPWREQTVDTLDSTGEQRWVSSRDAHRDHVRNFINAVRARKPHFEDSTFGFRAAGPALLCNTSYFEKRICTWDANAMIAG
ncbi:MAG: Gfo/Idh/MocA family oxidoreductase [Bryobacteraceae bacterium]|nr:Gfo/Idh/MocA family oxidoreductase [Bryobacteraceae bacterium]